MPWAYIDLLQYIQIEYDKYSASLAKHVNVKSVLD